MKEFKGTKGVWQLTTSALECDHNSEIATIWGDSELNEGAKLIAHIDNSPGISEALANAHLIAAAPELETRLQQSTDMLNALLVLFGDHMAVTTKFAVSQQIKENEKATNKALDYESR